jgi:hypothetical protein
MHKHRSHLNVLLCWRVSRYRRRYAILGGSELPVMSCTVLGLTTGKAGLLCCLQVHYCVRRRASDILETWRTWKGSNWNAFVFQPLHSAVAGPLSRHAKRVHSHCTGPWICFEDISSLDFAFYGFSAVIPLLNCQARRRKLGQHRRRCRGRTTFFDCS